MPNPFRREQDAFKMLVAFVAAAALVIAVTLISGSSALGLGLAALLVVAAIVKLWLDFRRWRAQNPPLDAEDDPA
ncbi:MAG: hypothetical protein ACR2OC_04480 [Solirubrobacterales bacterium]